MTRSTFSNRRWLAAVSAAFLVMLLLPAAARPGSVAFAGVQAPFTCRSLILWDIFHQDQLQPVDDVAPRNDRRFASGVNRHGLSVPGANGVRANDPTLAGYASRLITAPTHASEFTLDADGAYTWFPQPGYVGGDSFTYTLTGSTSSRCSGYTATVTIPPVDHRINDDSYTALVGQTFATSPVCIVDVCGARLNDLGSSRVTRIFYDHGDPTGRLRKLLPGQADTIILGFNTIVGSFQMNADGSFSLDPADPLFTGSFEFFYQTGDVSETGDVLPSGYSGDVSTSGLSYDQLDMARVRVTWAPPTGSLGLTNVVAIEDIFATPEDTPITITKAQLLANDAAATLVSKIFPPAQGTMQVNACNGVGCVFGEILSVTWTPPANFNGVIAFAYEAGSTSSTAVGTPHADVAIVVDPVADDPQPQDDDLTADRGVPTILPVLDNDIDVDDRIDRSTLALEFQPEGGAAGVLALVGDGTFRYTPDGSASQKTFSYVVKDVDGQTFQGNVSVAINPNAAANDAYTMDEDTILTVPAPGVLANDAGTGTLSTSSSGLTLNQDGSFTFQPPPNFAGPALLSYFYGGDTASIVVNVSPKADPPTLLLNVASCASICLSRPDPDDRDGLTGGDVARLRGQVADPERDPGTLVVDWGDGSTPTTYRYPCSYLDLLCALSLHEDQTWFAPILGGCGSASCGNVLYFDFAHAYAAPPTGGGLTYAITVTATSDDGKTTTASEHASLADADADGVGTGFDNCADVPNADQADADADGAGDPCDADDDGDTIEDPSDNCPLTANTDQADNDSDLQGNACDADDDNDAVLDTVDNCVFAANADQADNDGDDLGDACDPDDDDDRIADAIDNCQFDFNVNQRNTDGDALGDECDPDDDNDAVADGADNCQLVANAGQADFDADALGDACDPNDDNDTLPDTTDACDLEVPLGVDVDANGCTDTILGLQALVTNMPVEKKVKTPLLSKLGDAQKAYAQGKIVQAEGRLTEFIGLVETKRGKGLTTAQADLLIAYARNVILLI